MRRRRKTGTTRFKKVRSGKYLVEQIGNARSVEGRVKEYRVPVEELEGDQLKG